MQKISFLENKSPKQQTEVLKRAYAGMGYPRPGPFVKMLEARGCTDRVIKTLAGEMAQNSLGWKRVLEPPPRNQVSCPKTYKFNQLVGADCFFLPKFICPEPKYANKETRRVLHCQDMHLGWSEGALVSAIWKQDATEGGFPGNVSVPCLESLWCRRWGYPEGWYLDLAREFDCPEMLALCRDTGAEILCPPSRAHWANGKVERRGKRLKELIIRVKTENPLLPIELVVEEAIFQANAEFGQHGSSGYLRLAGYCPRIRGFSNDDPGQLAGPPESL